MSAHEPSWGDGGHALMRSDFLLEITANSLLNFWIDSGGSLVTLLYLLEYQSVRNRTKYQPK